MNHLSTTLKTILNGLAMQYEGDYLSIEDKKANLQRVLAEIEQEKKMARNTATAVSTPSNIAFHVK